MNLVWFVPTKYLINSGGSAFWRFLQATHTHGHHYKRWWSVHTWSANLVKQHTRKSRREEGSICQPDHDLIVLLKTQDFAPECDLSGKVTNYPGWVPPPHLVLRSEWRESQPLLFITQCPLSYKKKFIAHPQDCELCDAHTVQRFLNPNLRIRFAQLKSVFATGGLCLPTDFDLCICKLPFPVAVPTIATVANLSTSHIKWRRTTYVITSCGRINNKVHARWW